MEWLILWVLCGAICAGIASGKNLSIPQWLAIGCLLGVLAIPMVLFAEGNKDAE
jgi:hypothetical protein